MNEEKYILTKSQLLNLLQDRLKLQCLEENGVDNWVWYGENRDSFIADCLNVTEEEVEENGYGIYDVSIQLLKHYKEVD